MLSIIGTFFGVNKFALIAVAVAFIAGGYLGWHEKGLRISAILSSQAQAHAEACTKAQNITKEKNDELVSARNRIASNLERYKRLHPSSCIYLAIDGKLQPSEGQYAGVHGINTDTLRDYAALCETYRSELIVCSKK